MCVLLRSLTCIVFSSAAVSMGSAHAASFDCKKTVTSIEQMICQTPELNSLDSQLEGAYAGALDRSNHPDRIVRDQRVWLRERDACDDDKCLHVVYQRRIVSLSKVSDEPVICAGSTTPEVNSCEAEYAHRAERELARYLAAARKRLIGEASEDSDPQRSKTTLAAFNTSQKAWEAFRKYECNAVYDWWSEGTIRGAMYEGCMQSLTKSRTEQVWSTWLSFMDSTPPLLPKPGSR